MIDLTPLDVRSKRGDFKKLMRGYDPQEVDGFLELVAERLEALIRENMALKERSGALQAQVSSQSDREQAVQAALVTAQELRADIRNQAQREAENIVKAAETEGRRLIAEAEAEVRTKLRASERRADKLADDIQELERRRTRFLKDFRQLLERELDVVNVEKDRAPLEERTIDLELGTRRPADAMGAAAAGAVPRDDAPAARDVPAVRPGAGPEELPPPDVPVDELAAAYQQAETQGAVPLDEATGGSRSLRPPASARRQDDLLLYLEPDEAEGNG
jgi:cell division initiation protein